VSVVVDLPATLTKWADGRAMFLFKGSKYFTSGYSESYEKEL